jgi:Holliday junction resolvase-like predicted endonuclease
VARRGRLLVFVEVKTRRTRRFGDPELAVDAAKQLRLARGASAWLQARGGHAGPIRFDVIAWQVGPSGSQGREEWQLRHVEGAFDAGG